MPVSEAAAELGISAEAVRSRIKRDTLRSVKEGGAVYVLLEADQTPPERDQTTDQTAARSQSEPDALISEMRGRIEDLREQLEAEREAHAEARRLLLAALEKIPPAIEPPREAPGGPETAAAASEGAGGPRSATGEAQEAAERPQTPRSLWSRIFGR